MSQFRQLLLAPVLLSLLGQLTACSVNPVTGEQQLLLLPESQDFQIGQQQYAPAQQSQGGQYYLDPDLTFYVREVGNSLARQSDRKDLPYEFVVLNNSVPNAWALPSGKIAINRGLLVKLNDEAQLAAVLGHEVVHAAARHSAQRMQQGLIVQAGIAGLGMSLGDNDYRNIVVGGATLGAGLTVAKYGRSHELESDEFGIKYMVAAGYDPQAAVELQRIFVEMSKGRESGWIDGLLASHPPSPERVTANERTAALYPNAKRERGKDRFNKRMAYLRSKQAAYDDYDKAAAAFQKGDLASANTLVNKAIKVEGGDASFYALRGDIRTKEGKTKEAMADYDKAVALYPEMFSNYLKRGEANLQLGQLRAAESDFARSRQLLPTSIAALNLGNLAMQQNNPQRATGFYREAAQAQGPWGDAARKQLAQMHPTPPKK